MAFLVAIGLAGQLKSTVHLFAVVDRNFYLLCNYRQHHDRDNIEENKPRILVFGKELREPDVIPRNSQEIRSASSGVATSGTGPENSIRVNGEITGGISGQHAYPFSN